MINVGLVQINNSFSGQHYFPYSLGLLQSYAVKSPHIKDNYNFLDSIFKRVPVKAAVEHLAAANIVFFSVYTWNINLSLEIAKQLRKSCPEVVIAFGGPEVPFNRYKEFLIEHKFIDLICLGEGEKFFLAVLENLKEKKWENVPSACFISRGGEFVKNSLAERITNLDEVPSPYLSGVFDGLMKRNPDVNWIALWETNRGCPFRCSYCVWGAAMQNRIYTRSMQTIQEELDWFSNNKIEFIYCCDANFGIMPRDIEIAKYAAQNKRKYGYPKALSVQNTKNSTERIYNIYKVLSESGLSKGVALAMQSLNPLTLKCVRRSNISIETFSNLQRMFNKERIETFTDLIIGLPRETYKSFVSGISKIIENGQHNRIQNITLSILTNSEMDNSKYIEKHGFNIVKNRMSNIHGSIENSEEVTEMQRLVVATKSMPKTDWIKAKVFGWMAAILHFDKIMQVPFVVLHEVFSLSYKDLIFSFIKFGGKYRNISKMLDSFAEKAMSIQKGGHEYCASKKWLNIWWPVDELEMIKIFAENRGEAFYKEAGELLCLYFRKKGAYFKEILADSISLNKSLLKMPFNNSNVTLKLNFNVGQIYRGGLMGEKIALSLGEHFVEIDRTSQKWHSWEEWCREVIWYGNKRSAYLYPCRELEAVLK